MFRKLVSNLPFSPALVGQLGFYARRLRKEELTRRLGLLFTVLAVIVQSFAVFSPPEQAMASTASSIIPGGVSSISDILNHYDAGANGQNDYKAFMDYIGISRDDIARMSTKVVYVCSSDTSLVSFGRARRYSDAEGTLEHKVPLTNGGVSTFYSVPLFRFDSTNGKINCYDSYVGESSNPNVGYFAIMRKCANLQLKKNVQRFPKAHLITASCSVVSGYAYDERQLGQNVRLYLYFDGPPGQGKQYGPYTANQSTPTAPVAGAHGFSVEVPDQYTKLGRSVPVWAVMQPLPGWQQSLVQSDNNLTIPGNCSPAPQPIAACLLVTVNTIDRTHVSFDARAQNDAGANISAYVFTVTDKSGKKIYEKTINSTSPDANSTPIEIKSDGDYQVSVVVKTSIGDKSSVNCTSPFAISPQGNCIYNASLNDQDERCKPCPYKENIWIEDKNCVPHISQSKSAKNLSQNIADANGTTARTTDRIEYVIRTTNAGSTQAVTSIHEDLTDVLEYAQVIDTGGGAFNEQSKTLSWSDVKLAAGQTLTYHFVVQVFDKIPATPDGANDQSAYNCLMTNTYGNTISIGVECPFVKGIETTVKQLPQTGPGENVAFATILLMVVAYFYARSRQIKKEIKIIRKDFDLGSL